MKSLLQDRGLLESPDVEMEKEQDLKNEMTMTQEVMTAAAHPVQQSQDGSVLEDLQQQEITVLNVQMDSILIQLKQPELQDVVMA